jgi:hypothetical protein
MITIKYYKITNDTCVLEKEKTNIDFINKLEEKNNFVNTYNSMSARKDSLYTNTLVISNYNCVFSDLHLNNFRYIKIIIIGDFSYNYINKTIGFSENIIHDNYLNIFPDSSDPFNQSLDNLPNNLTHLIICGTNFNQQLCNLPETLEVLKLPCSFNKSFSNLPIGLKYLSVDNINYDYNFAEIPNNLLALQIRNLRQQNLNLTNTLIKYMFIYIKLNYSYTITQLPR